MSNKIFLGLMLVVFAVPLLLAATLKSKIKNGEFTVEKNMDENEENTRKGTFTSYKVIKIVSPHPELLMCNFQQSEEMNFKYNNYGSNDSLTVINQGDTLYIQFLAKSADIDSDQGENSGYGKTILSVNLPGIERLIVDGAMVMLDPVFANSDSLSVTLKNNAVIKEGNAKTNEHILPPPPVKEEKAKEVSQVNLEELESEDRELGVLENASVQLIDFSVKDVLINHLIKM